MTAWSFPVPLTAKTWLAPPERAYALRLAEIRARARAGKENVRLVGRPQLTEPPLWRDPGELRTVTHPGPGTCGPGAVGVAVLTWERIVQLDAPGGVLARGLCRVLGHRWPQESFGIVFCARGCGEAVRCSSS